jgi:two-component system, cell cycle response regulator DivK
MAQISAFRTMDDSEMTVLDSTALERLRNLGGDSLVRRMIELFCSHTSAKVEEARECLKRDDLQNFGRAVHSLRSSAGNVGASLLFELAGRLERLAIENKDSEVRLLFPELERALQQAAAQLRKEKGYSRMKKVVVIEDNPDNRELLRAILGHLYHVTDYSTGQEALEGIRKDRPDVILLDISLPGMDGMEILEKIRAEADLREIPVIALTAHVVSGDREKYLAAGFNDYIAKPILDEKVLYDAIERWAVPGP